MVVSDYYILVIISFIHCNIYMKRGPNDLDEIIYRLKKENKRLKKKIKTLVNTKFVDKVLNCKESM